MENANDTLRRVAEQLLNIADQTDRTNASSNASNSSATAHAPPNNSSAARAAPPNNSSAARAAPPNNSSAARAPPTTTQNNPAAEHRRVFSYGNRNKFYPQAAPSRKGKTKRQPCTLKFYCLGTTDEVKPPSTIAQKATLSKCCLGPGSITMDISTPSVHEYLLEKFPLLTYGGGYELLLYQRGGDEQGFHPLPMPYAASRLKEIAGQAYIYVRPLQRNILSLDESDQDGNVHKGSQEGPLVTCFVCNENIPMNEIRSHNNERHPKKLKVECVNLDGPPQHQNTVHEVKEKDTTTREETMKVQSNFDNYIQSDSEVEDESSHDIRKALADFERTSMMADSLLNGTGTSKKLSLDEQVNQLLEMFPDCTREVLVNTLNTHKTVSRAAISLSTNNARAEDDGQSSDSDLDNPVFLSRENEPSSLSLLMEDIKRNMSTERQKLKIDEDDILNDAMAFYKSPDFNPKQNLRVIFNNQPAADVGGVSRQFFTELLSMISEEFFIHGDKFKVPIYSAQVVASGIMKIIGTISVHSIVQEGPGLTIFSPAVYKYLATGDVDGVIQDVTVQDCSLRMQNYIKKVAEAVDVSELDQAETIDILSECGFTTTLTNENKMSVIQSLIVHDVIGIRKIVLDQLREGLSVLGFGKAMEKHQDIFQPLFVPSVKELTGHDVVTILKFPESITSEQKATKNYLVDYLENAALKTLQNFLTFATGSPCLPKYGLGTIKISFESVPSIYSSTCLTKIAFPVSFPDKETFAASMDATINNEGKSFNCV